MKDIFHNDWQLILYMHVRVSQWNRSKYEHIFVITDWSSQKWSITKYISSDRLDKSDDQFSSIGQVGTYFFFNSSCPMHSVKIVSNSIVLHLDCVAVVVVVVLSRWWTMLLFRWNFPATLFPTFLEISVIILLAHGLPVPWLPEAFFAWFPVEVSLESVGTLRRRSASGRFRVLAQCDKNLW